MNWGYHINEDLLKDPLWIEATDNGSKPKKKEKAKEKKEKKPEPKPKPKPKAKAKAKGVGVGILDIFKWGGGKKKGKKEAKGGVTIVPAPTP